MKNLHSELANILNRYSCENESDTPDFILAEYLMNCLSAFELASNKREDWYGCHHEPGQRFADPPTRRYWKTKVNHWSGKKEEIGD